MRSYIYKLFIPVAIGMMSSCGSSEEKLVMENAKVNVEVAVAQPFGSDETISVSGKIEASKSAMVSTRMMGAITGMKVQTGSKVSAGDLLLTISSADLLAKQAQVEASVAQAESGFQNASKDLQRFESLFKKGSASEKELENIRTRYEMAEAGLKAANEMKNEIDAQFKYTYLRAPFDGVVTNTFVKEGDMANPGMPLMAVEGTRSYEAAVLVPESYISAVKSGATAVVTIKSNKSTIAGRVIEVSPSAKHTGGQFIAKIQLESIEGIYPGMFINAEIRVGSDQKQSVSPAVHEGAVVKKGQLRGIYTVSEQNTAVLRWIRTGNQTKNKIEVLSGLGIGERYVVSAEGKLYNGASVVIR